MSVERNVESDRKRKKRDKQKKNDKESLHDGQEGHAQQETGATEKIKKDLLYSAQIKKRKHSDVADKIENITDRDQPDKQKRKRRSKGRGGEELEDEGPKEHKTRSKRNRDDAAASDNGSDSKGLSENSKISKKRREKNNVSPSLPDPAQDTTLTDKARNALSYAYARLASPESWKFNKAHQNWIVKHLFTLDSVPGKYDSVVIGYLSGCQGAVRQNLIDVCTKQLEPAAEHNEPDASSGTGGTTEPPADDNVETDNSGSSPEIREMLGTRARLLLEALTRPLS